MLGALSTPESADGVSHEGTRGIEYDRVPHRPAEVRMKERISPTLVTVEVIVGGGLKSGRARCEDAV